LAVKLWQTNIHYMYFLKGWGKKRITKYLLISIQVQSILKEIVFCVCKVNLLESPTGYLKEFVTAFCLAV